MNDYKKELEKYENTGIFNEFQLGEIKKGLEEGLDVTIYAEEQKYKNMGNFNHCQLKEIERGLKNGVDVSIYAKECFDEYQMEEIRRGLEKGIDVTLYAKECFDEYQMRKIRKKEMRKIEWYPENNMNMDTPLKNQIKYGYKAFNKDMSCRGLQYKEGDIFTLNDELSCCKKGFHFCLNIEDCFKYYDKENCIIHKVEILGDVDTTYYNTKCSTNKIKILERVYPNK